MSVPTCPICGRADKRACEPGAEADECARRMMFDQFGVTSMPDASAVAQNDLAELLTILGMGDHARPQSPHEVFQEALSVLRKRLGAERVEEERCDRYIPVSERCEQQASLLTDEGRHEVMFAAIRAEAESALAAAATNKSRNFGAVNWGDLCVVEVLHCRDEAGYETWRVLIEEASPGCDLGYYVYERLALAFPGVIFDVSTEW